MGGVETSKACCKPSYSDSLAPSTQAAAAPRDLPTPAPPARQEDARAHSSLSGPGRPRASRSCGGEGLQPTRSMAHHEMRAKAQEPSERPKSRGNFWSSGRDQEGSASPSPQSKGHCPGAQRMRAKGVAPAQDGQRRTAGSPRLPGRLSKREPTVPHQALN